MHLRTAAKALLLAVTTIVAVCAAPTRAVELETSVPASFGINDPDCVPTGQVREPVVLIHGTSDNASNWETLIPRLQEQGMCVWAFDYGADDLTLQNAVPGMKAIGDLDASAREVASQIDYVRSVTGAAKVDLVGHSQGGLHEKTFTQMYGSPDDVNRVVALGGNFHGTTLNGMAPTFHAIDEVVPKFASFLGTTAGLEQLQGSDFFARLNALPDTAAGIMYTSIYTPGDITVTPNSTSELNAVPGADVANVDLGAVCGESIAHSLLPHDDAALAEVIWGLTRAPGEQPTRCANA